MSNKIKEYPIQFRDNIDKFLFDEMSITGGCCSYQGSFEYSVARECAEKVINLAVETLNRVYVGNYREETVNALKKELLS
mgnify:CR=1 FL=1|jgi:hypothetical protein